MGEGEQDHDGAGVDDDLSGGEELRAERPIEDGERHHDDDERERAVDGARWSSRLRVATSAPKMRKRASCMWSDGPWCFLICSVPLIVEQDSGAGLWRRRHNGWEGLRRATWRHGRLFQR